MKNLLSFITAFFLLAQPAWAAEGVKISPVSFDLTGIPGQKLENVVKVSNPSDKTIGIETSISDFAPQGEDGGVALQSQYRYGLSSYLSVFPKSFSLQPGELKFVTITATIPKDATPGARSGAVLFGDAAAVGISGSGSVISGQVGVIMTLNVLGDLKDQAKVVEFQAPVLATSGPTSFTARIQNTGTTLAKFKGNLRIYNILGAKVADVTLGPNNILPDAIRKFGGAWGEQNPFGLYRAEVDGTFGTQPLKTTVYFLGASPSYVGAALILALLGLTLLNVKKKRAK